MSEEWKAKYLQELESVAVREANWVARQHALERMLVRTSLAAEGQNVELDRLMAKLRTRLRKSNDKESSLASMQGLIDKQLLVLDEDKKQAAKQLFGEFRALVAEGRRHPLLAHQAARLKVLEKTLQPALLSGTELANWLSDFLALLTDALARPDSDAPLKKSLLTRVLGRDRSASDAAQHTNGGTAGVSEACMRIAHRTSELMGYVLSKIEVEPTARIRADELREQLAASRDWDTLYRHFNGLANLIVAAINRGQKKFEGYLDRLDERLALLQKSFVTQSEVLGDSQQAAQTFDEALRGDLRKLGSDVVASDDLLTLKVSVSEQIDGIVESMDQFRTEELKREQVLAGELAVMKEKLAAMEIRSERISQQLGEERLRAQTDVLTQLPNRKAWEERLSFEFSRWQRYGYPVVIGILDIDHFKKVNDNYGHTAGDRVLEKLAEALQQRLRNTDFVARYGGEEFVFILPETDLDNAFTVIDQLRKHVGELPFHFRGEPVSVSLSAGITEMTEGDDEASLFDRADKALYDAKNSGRNCVHRRSRD